MTGYLEIIMFGIGLNIFLSILTAIVFSIKLLMTFPRKDIPIVVMETEKFMSEFNERRPTSSKILGKLGNFIPFYGAYIVFMTTPSMLRVNDKESLYEYIYQMFHYDFISRMGYK